MTAGPLRYLLDTNILVHFVNDSDTWDSIRKTYRLFAQPITPRYSIVTRGELQGLAKRRNWGGPKLKQLNFGLRCFVQDQIFDDVVDRYAIIDDYLWQRGLKLSKNDLWISATALFRNAILLSTDRDFFPLQQIGLRFQWIPTLKTP